MKSREIPFSFVVDELFDLDLKMKPMFGCHAFYRGEKILFILRKKSEHVADNGVWIVTNNAEDREILRKKIPSLRSLELFGTPDTAWQNIPEDSFSFEEEVMIACELIRKGSPLIGKIPAKKKKSASTVAIKSAPRKSSAKMGVAKKAGVKKTSRKTSGKK